MIRIAVGMSESKLMRESEIWLMTVHYLGLVQDETE